MAHSTLRRRVHTTTIIYSLMLIGVVFILTWRAYSTQREIERIVRLQSEAVDVLGQFKMFHAGLDVSWTRAADDGPEALADAVRRYTALAADRRDELKSAPAAPRQLAAESEALDRLAAVTAARWRDTSPTERRRSLETLRRQTLRIVEMTDEAIRTAGDDIDRRLELLVAAGRNTMWTALGAAYIVAVIGIALAHNAMKRVVQPLEALVVAADGIANGKYETRAPTGGDVEIAMLGQSFNEMASRVQAAVAATEHRARTDDLTGLPNFRAFSEMIAAEIERAGRYESSFGLLVFDIDHFKKYNDSYGHLAGNEALQLVSSTIRQTLRTVDTAARYGGEEFAAILPQVDEEAMRVIGERARRAVQNLPPISDRRRLTVSIGGAIFPRDGRTAESLFQAADQRLYEAKERGRNMVVTPEPRLQRGTRSA
jgi:two-component system cell cycle response regulator